MISKGLLRSTKREVVMPRVISSRVLFSFVCVPAIMFGGVAFADPPNGRIEAGNQADLGEQAKGRMSKDDTLKTDAEALSASTGIPFGQALKAVRAQDSAANSVTELRREFGGRVAGIYTVLSPDYKIVVRLKGQGAPNRRMLKLADGDVPIEFETGAQHSVDELVAAYEKNFAAVQALFPTLQGLGTDEKTGEIVVIVAAQGSAAETVRGKRDDLFRLLGHPVKIDVVANETTDSDVRGGSKITSSAGGACTSGFTVKNAAGTTGITTSAHCEGINTYFNPNGTTIALAHSGVEIKDADQDVEIHTSGYIERAQFYADSATVPRSLTGSRLQTSTAIGNQVCHRGTTTGYSCGLVSATNYKPSYVGACGAVTCDSVWVKVDGDANTACSKGDSGGPVFASQTAFGLLKATSSSGPAKGQCSFFVYMSTDLLPPGWSLVFE
jgi:streptogrisin C